MCLCTVAFAKPERFDKKPEEYHIRWKYLIDNDERFRTPYANFCGTKGHWHQAEEEITDQYRIIGLGEIQNRYIPGFHVYVKWEDAEQLRSAMTTMFPVMVSGLLAKGFENRTTEWDEEGPVKREDFFAEVYQYMKVLKPGEVEPCGHCGKFRQVDDMVDNSCDCRGKCIHDNMGLYCSNECREEAEIDIVSSMADNPSYHDR